MKSIRSTLLILLILIAGFPQRAFAYLDPGTGSYIFQLLIAAVVGSLFALKMFWRQLLDLFRRSGDRPEHPVNEKEIPSPDEKDSSD